MSTPAFVPVRRSSDEGASGDWDRLFNGLPTWSIALGVFAILLLVAGLVSVVVVANSETTTRDLYVPGNNCSLMTCTGASGPTGGTGGMGPVGQRGEKGDKGDKGDQGDQGVPGEIGPEGTCLNNNPACLQGPQGVKGDKGDKGDTGAQGIPGQQGSIGATGATGPSGPSGPIGLSVTGPSGPVGATGACDCLMLGSATYSTVNITTALTIPSTSTITLEGTMTCPGGALAPNCFGLATCPDFSTCDLSANSLTIQNPSTLQGLLVTKTNVTISSPAPFTNSFTAGNSGILNQKLLSWIQYAVTTVIDAQTSLTMRALFGSIYIQTGITSPSNNIFIDSLAGQVIVSAASGAAVSTSTGSIGLIAGQATQYLDTVGGVYTAEAVIMSLNSPNITLRDNVNSLNWLRTDPTQSYTCPLVGTALIPDVSRVSTTFSGDVVLNTGSRLLSLNPSGKIEISGLSLFCNSSITTVGGVPLVLGENNLTLIDIRGGIVNFGGSGVLVADTTGLIINDTSTANSTSRLYTNGIDVVNNATLTVYANTTFIGPDGVAINNGLAPSTSGLFTNRIDLVDDTKLTLVPDTTVTGTNGLTIDNGAGPSTSRLSTNGIQVADGTTVIFYNNVEIRGNLLVSGVGGGGGATISAPTGTITASSGTVSAPGGSCCTSDKRVKQNITDISTKSDLQKILDLPRRVSFKYTDEYLKTDPNARDIVHDGYIAQELEERGFDMMVNKHKEIKLQNGEILKDFRTIQLERLVPYLVGAIQELTREIEELKKR